MTPLREVVAVFLRLGLVAFGGPAAHIALMREELVRRRRWLSDAQFVDLLGITNLIPGPNSTEMAIHLGYTRAGGVGARAGRRLLHRARDAQRDGARLGVRALGDAARGDVAALRRQARDHRDRAAGDVGARAHRRARPAARRGVRGGGGAGAGRRPRAAGPLRRRRPHGPRPRAEPPGGGHAGGPRVRDAGPRAGDRGGRGRRRGARHDDARVPQDRRGALRQRLRAAGVPARGLRRAAWLADGSPAARRGRGGAGDAGPRVHDGHLHRLPARGMDGRRAGDGRHLPALVRVRGGQPARAAPVARLAPHGRVPRRRQRRGARPHGRRHVGARARGDRRRAHGRAGARRHRAARDHAREPRPAARRGRRPRPRVAGASGVRYSPAPREALMNQRRRTFLKTSVLGTAAAAAGLRPGFGPGHASAATASDELPRGLTFVTLRNNGDASLGIKTDRGIVDVRAAEAAFKLRAPTTIDAVLQGRGELKALPRLVERAAGRPNLVLAEDTVKFGPCVTNPEKIICVGLNYRKHAAETGNPVPKTPILFNKYNNALAGHKSVIRVADEAAEPL